jgi:gliding motility-associated-like protein
MKTKFLLCILLVQTLMGYSSALGGDRPTTIASYFDKLKSLVSKTQPEKPLNLNPSLVPAGQVCRSYTSLGIMASMLWSDNATWTTLGIAKPVAGSAVTIPANAHLILDESPPNLASLTINGKLEFARQDLNLTAGWIMVMGTLEVGTSTSPFTNQATITLNATDLNGDALGMGMGTRGILVMGGKLELHGAPPTKHYTKISDHAAKGATSLTLLDAVSWKVDDQIVVAPTDYYGAGGGTAQRTQITAVNSTSLTIQDGLNAQRWGKLQYLTKDGMSLTPGTLPAGILEGTPTVLDERAEVANLTRNIVVQSPDDDLWQNNGFGCHIMVMKMDLVPGEARLNGVEIKRGGQAGKLGRYPFHWHMLSYEGSTTLSDVTDQYIRNSTINQSSQRGIVIHGTNGAEVKNNVVYDVRGHGVFTEDAAERRNIIDGNLVLKIRSPLPGQHLKLHESEDDFISASGFWISNPDNTVINNTATDCKGVGFWLAFPRRTFGASAQIVLNPNYLKFGTFNNNHTHSNQRGGIHIDHAEIDELGTTADTPQYISTTDMQEPQWPYTYALAYELGDYTTWKNNATGIWNRSALVRNRRVVNADNTERFFSGTSNTELPGAIEKSLVVSVSLNYNMNGMPEPTAFGSGPHSAFASYHSTFDITDNVVVNFEGVANKASGFFALNDYYITPVDKGNVRNPRNILINSHPGVRTMPGEPQHAYGVLWDHHNYCGGPANQDNYYVFDTPFFTYGKTRHEVAPSPAISGGVIIEGPFYGFHEYHINGFHRSWDKIAVTRTNAAGTTVGNWVVEAGQRGDILGVMRHFATHPTGHYFLDFPTIADVNDFTIRVSNMLTTNDYQVLSVKYSGNYTITQLFASTAYDMREFGNTKPFPGAQANVRPYKAVADFQAVVNAQGGEVYWHDKTGGKVWFKVKGGVGLGAPDKPADHDLNLYKDFHIRAYGTYTSPNPAYTVNFTVKDANGAPLPDATVEFRGNRAVSNASGVATFTNVPPGTDLLYIATKDGHNNVTGTLNVTSANVAQNIVLPSTGNPAYTVTFTVKDVSGTLQTYTQVSFNGENWATNSEGRVEFKNVAPGTNLPYSASKTPQVASGTVSVAAANVAHTIVLGTVSSPAPTYAVTFTVKDATNALMSGASVTFNGQTLTSNASGVVSFTNVAAGTNLPYTATKTGFNTSTGSVNVTSANVAQNITLSAVGSPTYTVTFTVKDATEALVSGASVTFRGQTLTSNASGVATFTSIPAGTSLAYDVKKTGYNTASGTVTVAANVAQNVVLTAVGSPTYSVSFTIKDDSEALLADALVSFNGETMTTTASGEVVFSNVAPGIGLPYSVSKTGFEPLAGSLSVASTDVTQSLVLIPSTVTEPNPEPEPEPVAQLNPRNIFSPNGDGINELWEVEGIEQQPQLRVLIFNGYGQRVFQAQPYTNSWDGGGLPDGVYYYQVQNPEGKPVKKGAITLVR